MPRRPLHIAWVSYPPGEGGAIPGISRMLLQGLLARGHRIDCFLTGERRELPGGLGDMENLTPVWGKSGWRWNRWYSRSRPTAYVSSRVAYALSARRLRRELARRHREDPYDLIYQGGTMSPAVPVRILRSVPLVSHPQTHFAGELRYLVAEWRLALRCQPAYILAVAATARWLQTIYQRRGIRRADLLIGISAVLRDQIVADYGFPVERTVVIPSPIEGERFHTADAGDRDPGATPTVIMLSRIIARKGVEDVVALAKLMHERKADVRFRLVGGPSVWSDYTKLLDDLPPENSEYVRALPGSEMPSQLARSDVLLLASKYEPFGLVVGEALASGIPVVGSSAVGAIGFVDSSVAAVVEPGDVDGLAAGITEMLDRVRRNPEEMRSRSRAEAERLFAPDVVCDQISDALERLVDSRQGDGAAGPASAAA